MPKSQKGIFDDPNLHLLIDQRDIEAGRDQRRAKMRLQKLLSGMHKPLNLTGLQRGKCALMRCTGFDVYKDHLLHLEDKIYFPGFAAPPLGK